MDKNWGAPISVNIHLEGYDRFAKFPRGDMKNRFVGLGFLQSAAQPAFR